MSKTHVIDGKSFVEVERKAKVGDYVVNNKGTEYEAIYKVTGYFPEDSTPPSYRVAYDPDEDGATVGVSIERSITLEPVDQAPSNTEDLIANLVRRVAALERQVDSLSTQLRDVQNNVERQGVEIAEVTHLAKSNEADIRDLDERTQPKPCENAPDKAVTSKSKIVEFSWMYNRDGMVNVEMTFVGKPAAESIAKAISEVFGQ